MNPVLLKKQLRENATDLQDFYKDLKNWGEEMKRKEDSLKNSEDNSKRTKGKTSKDVLKIDPIPKEKMSKIGSTDYAKWEKFDADLECENIEDDIKDDSELTDEFEESARDEALVQKEKGNSYVKMKEWDKAIDCYTKAISCYSYDPIFYANRALCYIKKDRFISAEEDCTLSLRLDSTYVKALQRRAAAREGLGKLELAVVDLELVLTHEPKNKESLAALGRIKKKIGLMEKVTEGQQRPVSKFTASRNKIHNTKPVVASTVTKATSKPIKPENSQTVDSISSTSAWPDPGCDITHVKSIKKPPHLRSKKPLKRIEISEIDSFRKDEEVSNNSFKMPEAFKKIVVEHVREDKLQEVILDASEPVEKTSCFKRNREKTRNERNEMQNSDAWPKSTSKIDIIRSDDLKILEKKPVTENKPKAEKNTENILITKMDNKSAKSLEDTKASTPAVTINTDFSVPKTSVQFYTTWKFLKSVDHKYKFLRLIDPQDLPNIFRESLDCSVFSNILEILSTSFVENEDDVYEFLFQLTKVKRFSALTMFMDSGDKNRLWKIIGYLREKSKIPSEKIDNLVLKYEL